MIDEDIWELYLELIRLSLTPRRYGHYEVFMQRESDIILGDGYER